MQRKSVSSFQKLLLVLALLFPVAFTSAGVASAQTVTPRPCDLYASTTPCVAAYGTTRAMYSAYAGPLYQLTRQSDEARLDVGLLPDGYANAAAQDTFCARTSCTINELYD